VKRPLTNCTSPKVLGNAIDQVKSIANDITKTNNEDGVAWYLENHLLK